jgi:hypothetical protein
MIRETRVTSRDLHTNEQETLNELQQLHPGWTYVGVVETIKLFRLVIISE